MLFNKVIPWFLINHFSLSSKDLYGILMPLHVLTSLIEITIIKFVCREFILKVVLDRTCYYGSN